MNHTSHTIYTILSGILLGVIVLFLIYCAFDTEIMEAFPQLRMHTDRFYMEKSQSDLEYEEWEFNNIKERAREVTYDDYMSIGQSEAVSVELSVVEVYHNYTTSYSHTSENYNLIGEDVTGALWCVNITRSHISEPMPEREYQEGQRIIVYGYMWDDEFIEKYETRMPRISYSFIEVVN